MKDKELQFSQEIAELKEKSFEASGEEVDKKFDELVGLVKRIARDPELTDEGKRRLYDQISKPEAVRRVLDKHFPEGFFAREGRIKYETKEGGQDGNALVSKTNERKL